MIRHHNGSGRRTTIHPDWSEMFRPVTEGARTCVVELRHPGGTRGAFNTTTGQWGNAAANAPYYTGKARIQTISDSEAHLVTAEEEVASLAYRVTIDSAVSGMRVEDTVTIVSVEDNGDQWMAGQFMTIEAIVTGSLQWERHLVCVHDLKQVTG